MLTGALGRDGPGIDLWDRMRLAVLASPVAVLALLFLNPTIDPAVEVPGWHFAIVTLAAGAAALVALAVLAVAEEVGDPRAFYLGLAFCAIAGFFFVHGVLTPGVLVPFASTGIGWAPVLSLCLGSLCLALSTARLRPAGEPWVFRRRKAIAALLGAAWVAFLATSLLVPTFLRGHPTSLARPRQAAAPAAAPGRYGDPAHAHRATGSDNIYGENGMAAGPQAPAHPAPAVVSVPPATPPATAPPSRSGPWIVGALLGATAGLLTYSALRYLHLYRLSRLSLHATILAGIILLFESLVPLALGTVWRLSWWSYHILILAGVSAILYGVVLDYRQGASLPKTVSLLLLRGPVEALEQSYNEVLTGLVAAVEARDPYTKGHSEKVARMAVRIGERLGLGPEQLRLLHQAGLLHDIGKIGIPDSILKKPDRLTDTELAIVREHPLRSEEMISRIRSLRPTLRAVRWHHERLNGSGYPDGLRGDAIPLEARILAVADVFDAMTSGRSYRPAWPAAAVVAHLQEEAGRLYDARCVAAVREMAAAGEDRPALAALAPARSA